MPNLAAGQGGAMHERIDGNDRVGRWQARILVAWVALALLLGGGGSPNPASELALQVASVVLLGACFALDRDARWPPPPRPLLLIALLALALPALQLIPLPAAIWHALPGRELERAALELIDQQGSVRPFSIAPNRTLASLLAMIPPLALGFVVAAQPLARRREVLATVATMALASALIGAAQIAGPGDAFRLYPDAHLGWLTGFQASRNAAADVLMIGAMAAMAWFASAPAEQASRRSFVLPAALGVLLAALLFTGSRAGIILLAVVVPALVLMTTARGHPTKSRLVVSITVAVVVAFALIALLALADERLAQIASRFGMLEDYRLGLWRDCWSAMLAYWPWGAGIGTFVPAFIPYESLASVDPTFPNRAHNDLLELAIEAGLPGMMALAGVAVLVMRLASSALRDPTQPRALAIFGLQTFILIGLHSLVDYPLRNMAVASLAGIALGMLAPLRDARVVARGS